MSGLLLGEEGILLEYAYQLVDLLLTLVFTVNPYKPETSAHSAKPDQTPHFLPSDQVLHCLLTEISFKI